MGKITNTLLSHISHPSRSVFAAGMGHIPAYVKVLLPAIILISMQAIPYCMQAKVKGGVSRAAVESQRVRDKARHFYLKGVEAEAQGKGDIATEYYRYAYSVDSTYPEAAYQYGIRRLTLPGDSSATPREIARSRRIIERFTNTYSGDLFPQLVYARLLDQLQMPEAYIEILEKMRGYHPTNSDIVQLLSNAYMDNRQYDKALEAIDAYSLAEGEDYESTVRKATVQIAKGDSIGALRTVDGMIAKFPRNTQYPVFKSQLYLYLDHPDSALMIAEQAERLVEPGTGGAVKLQLADIYRQQGDSLNFDAKINEALLAEDIPFETKNAILTEYLQDLIAQAGDRTRGDRLFDGLLRQYPHESSLRALSSRYAASKGDMDKAVEEIEYALDLDGQNADYWELAMMYMLSDSDWDKAYALYKKSLETLESPSIQMDLMIGNVAIMKDQYDEALKIYSEALEKHYPGQIINKPLDMNALAPYLTYETIDPLISLYRQIGDAYYFKNEFDEMKVNYENALLLNSYDPLTLNNYAYYLIKDKNRVTDESLRRADELSKSAIDVEPDNMIYQDTRAWVYFMKGEYAEALEMMQKVMEKIDSITDDESRHEYYSHYGDILYANDRKEEAVSAWEEALKAQPDDAELKNKITNGL